MKIKKKILKNILIQNILSLIAAIYIFIVKLTCKFNYENDHIAKKYWTSNKPFILAFWHNQLMTVSFSWKIKNRLNILASSHSDGRIGAIIGKYFRLNNIPIFSNSNMISLRPIFKILKSNKYIGITPDGPRGPKEKVSEGIIKISKSTGVPIIPIGFWSSKNFKLNSWDSFLITLPFSKCYFFWGEPLFIPKNINKNDIKKFQEVLEKRMNECTLKAKQKS